MESMSGPYMHNAFWHEGQVAITLQLSQDFASSHINSQESISIEATSILGIPRERLEGVYPPTFNKTAVIRAVNLVTLRDNLAGSGYSLSSFNVSETLQPEGSPEPSQQGEDADKGEAVSAVTEDDINSEIGKYLFATRDTQENFVPTLICFFNFIQGNAALTGTPATLADFPDMFEATTSSTGMAPMPDREGNSNGQERSNNGQHPPVSPVVDLVKLINAPDRLRSLREQGVPIVAASPVWYAGATQTQDPRPVGCPLTPPIPVDEDVSCSSSPGLFPITLPELPRDLRSMTGDGVTIIVLDTLPRREEIGRAIEAAEKHNLLLLDVARNVRFHHNRLPASLEVAGVSRPATGKDINGKLIGFRMPDHGLFVAGIIRDLTPNARIECVRVLNDYCVGDMPTLTKSLETIQHRMSPQDPDNNNLPGDLVGKPVVINMSLVIPPDNELLAHGFDAADLENLRKDLGYAIEGLAQLGVMFVASAGNEGDLRYPPANPDGIRPEALYPAAFAYSGLKYPYMMMPVGAVNKHSKAASYSCYPGDRGIGVYGGEVPKASKKKRDGCYTRAIDIDAPIGLYTALSYPALSVDDCEPTYPEPNANAWAYWVGTSFATPVITAVAARVIEYVLRHVPPGTILTPNTHFWHGITQFAAQGRTVTWDRIGEKKDVKIGPMILAVQKQCEEDEVEEDEEDEEVIVTEQVEVVNLTINEFTV